MRLAPLPEPNDLPATHTPRRRRWLPSALLIPVAAGFLRALELDPIRGHQTRGVLASRAGSTAPT